MPATTDTHTLSLHDALPIWRCRGGGRRSAKARSGHGTCGRTIARRASRACTLQGGRLDRVLRHEPDRKSTRLNSSHLGISYSVFYLKKKQNSNKHLYTKS